MRHRRRPPAWLLPGSAPWFPDPVATDAEGLVAIGGDLSPDRLLLAYERGIFPWYAEGIVPMWWCPDPRGVFLPGGLHVSRRLCRRLRAGGFERTWNRAFRQVMAECGRGRAEGTWVIDDMLDAYERLHALGRAHSLEVWAGGELVGGVYGVQVGGLFAAESMFHRRTDMSKVALVSLARSLFARGIEVIDAQFVTPHLASLGAVAMPRAEYLTQVRRLGRKTVDLAGVEPAH